MKNLIWLIGISASMGIYLFFHNNSKTQLERTGKQIPVGQKNPSDQKLKVKPTQAALSQHKPHKPLILIKTQPTDPPVVQLEKSQQTTKENPYKRPTGQIPFKIENGWAIAYGDVLLGTVKGPAHIKSGTHNPKKPRLWDSAIIPFGIHADLLNKKPVRAAIQYFNKNTAVKFVPFEGKDEDAIIFVPDENNCASYIGRIGGLQPIMVASKCGRQELIHELMHALGFVHEHSRVDRDNYLEVQWDNIENEYWPQFAIVPDELIHEYRGRVFDFDPKSAMLYPPTAFAKKPRLITLKGINNTQLTPVLDGLSETDMERIFYLYGN